LLQGIICASAAKKMVENYFKKNKWAADPQNEKNSMAHAKLINICLMIVLGLWQHIN